MPESLSIAITIAANSTQIGSIPPIRNSLAPLWGWKHACPGRWLAKAEIIGFVASLVQKYKITTSKTEKPKLQFGTVTTRMEEKIPLLLERRDPWEKNNRDT